MLYRFLLGMLVMFLAVACGDSSSGPLKKAALIATDKTFLPTLPPNPMLPAAFTVGTLLQSSGVSPAGEYFVDMPLDVPPGRADAFARVFERRGA